VRSHGPVGVHHDLPPGEPGVGLRPADLEPSRGVHQHPNTVGLQPDLPEHGIDDLGHDVGGQQRLDVDLLAVLGGDDHRVDPHGFPVLVFDGHLALAVRT